MREVALHLSSRAFIAQQRLVAVPELIDIGRAATATLTTTVTLTNASAQPLAGTLTGDVCNEAGGPSVLTATSSMPVLLSPGASQEITLTL